MPRLWSPRQGRAGNQRGCLGEEAVGEGVSVEGRGRGHLPEHDRVGESPGRSAAPCLLRWEHRLLPGLC